MPTGPKVLASFSVRRGVDTHFGNRSSLLPAPQKTSPNSWKYARCAAYRDLACKPATLHYSISAGFLWLFAIMPSVVSRPVPICATLTQSGEHPVEPEMSQTVHSALARIRNKSGSIAASLELTPVIRDDGGNPETMINTYLEMISDHECAILLAPSEESFAKYAVLVAKAYGLPIFLWSGSREWQASLGAMRARFVLQKEANTTTYSYRRPEKTSGRRRSLSMERAARQVIAGATGLTDEARIQLRAMARRMDSAEAAGPQDGSGLNLADMAEVLAWKFQGLTSGDYYNLIPDWGTWERKFSLAEAWTPGPLGEIEQRRLALDGSVWTSGYDNVWDVNFPRSERLRGILEILREYAIAKPLHFISQAEDPTSAHECALGIDIARHLGFATLYYTTISALNFLRMFIWVAKDLQPEVLVLCGDSTHVVRTVLEMRVHGYSPAAIVTTGTPAALTGVLTGSFANYVSMPSPLPVRNPFGGNTVFFDRLSDFLSQSADEWPAVSSHITAIGELLVQNIQYIPVLPRRFCPPDGASPPSTSTVMGEMIFACNTSRNISGLRTGSTSMPAQLVPNNSAKAAIVRFRQSTPKLVLSANMSNFDEGLMKAIAEPGGVLGSQLYGTLKYPSPSWLEKEIEGYPCPTGCVVIPAAEASDPSVFCKPCKPGRARPEGHAECVPCTSLERGLGRGYADGWGFPDCLHAPTGSTLRSIDRAPTALVGYWVMDGLDNLETTANASCNKTTAIKTTVVVKCPQPSTCLGENRCLPFHVGVACGACMRGYVWSRSRGHRKCTLCPGKVFIALRFLCVCLVMWAVLWVLCAWCRIDAGRVAAVRGPVLRSLIVYFQCRGMILDAHEENPLPLLEALIILPWEFCDLDCILASFSNAEVSQEHRLKLWSRKETVAYTFFAAGVLGILLFQILRAINTAVAPVVKIWGWRGLLHFYVLGFPGYSSNRRSDGTQRQSIGYMDPSGAKEHCQEHGPGRRYAQLLMGNLISLHVEDCRLHLSAWALLVFPCVVRQSLTLIVCSVLPGVTDDVLRLRVDPNILCHGTEYESSRSRSYALAGCTVLIVVLSFYWLATSEVLSTKWRLRKAILIQGYKPTVLWWQTLENARIIALLLCYILPNTVEKVVGQMLCIFCSMLAYMALQPFEVMERQALHTITLLGHVILLFEVCTLERLSLVPDSIQIALTFPRWLLNITFCVYCAWVALVNTIDPVTCMGGNRSEHLEGSWFLQSVTRLYAKCVCLVRGLGPILLGVSQTNGDLYISFDELTLSERAYLESGLKQTLMACFDSQFFFAPILFQVAFHDAFTKASELRQGKLDNFTSRGDSTFSCREDAMDTTRDAKQKTVKTWFVLYSSKTVIQDFAREMAALTQRLRESGSLAERDDIESAIRITDQFSAPVIRHLCYVAPDRFPITVQYAHKIQVNVDEIVTALASVNIDLLEHDPFLHKRVHLGLHDQRSYHSSYHDSDSDGEDTKQRTDDADKTSHLDFTRAYEARMQKLKRREQELEWMNGGALVPFKEESGQLAAEDSLKTFLEQATTQRELFKNREDLRTRIVRARQTIGEVRRTLVSKNVDPKSGKPFRRFDPVSLGTGQVEEVTNMEADLRHDLGSVRGTEPAQHNVHASSAQAMRKDSATENATPVSDGAGAQHTDVSIGPMNVLEDRGVPAFPETETSRRDDDRDEGSDAKFLEAGPTERSPSTRGTVPDTDLGREQSGRSHRDRQEKLVNEFETDEERNTRPSAETGKGSSVEAKRGTNVEKVRLEAERSDDVEQVRAGTGGLGEPVVVPAKVSFSNAEEAPPEALSEFSGWSHPQEHEDAHQVAKAESNCLAQ